MLHRFMSAAAGVRAPMWRIVLLELTTAPIDGNSVVSSSELSPLGVLHFVSCKCCPTEQVVCTPVPLGGLDQRNVVIRHCSWLAGSSGYYDNCCPYMTPCSCHIIIIRQCYCRPRAAAITTALPAFLLK